MSRLPAPRWQVAVGSIALLLSLIGLREVLSGSPPAPEPTPTRQAPLATAAQAAETPQAAPGEITLRWRTRPDNRAESDVYRTISAYLDKTMTDVALVYEPGGSEDASYQDVLRTELAAGTAPDVFWIPGTDVADFATRGLILDLRPFAASTPAYADEHFYPGPMRHLTYNPKTGQQGEVLWGVPRDVSTFVLYLNLDLIEEAGVPDPRALAKTGQWNWENFLKTAQAVSRLSHEIKGYGQNAWWGSAGYWIISAGGSFFDPQQRACALDSEAARVGLEFERDLYMTHKVAVPYGQDAEPPFLAGVVGMFQNGRWATPGMRRNARFRWDVVEMPTGPGGPTNWLFWGAYVVNAETKHPAEAFRLITELTSQEVQQRVSALGVNIPSRPGQAAVSQFLNFRPPDNNQAFLNGLAGEPMTEAPLWDGDWPLYDQTVAPMFSALLNGEITVAEFQTRVCPAANRAFMD